jgi:hypothetical protein
MCGRCRRTSAQAGLESDIPGFFYDPSTKKYYKIAPGQHQFSVEQVRDRAKVCLAPQQTFAGHAPRDSWLVFACLRGQQLARCAGEKGASQ